MAESLVSIAAKAPLLGVSRSALGRRWQARSDAAAEMIATAIAQTHGVPDSLARLLAGRGVALADVPGFLAPRLRDLMPDPSVLADMDAAATRIARAAETRETVAIFADYDVDGAASAALLAEYLESFGARALVHIPDRITEGYGPNVEAIRALHGQNATLLVTVDCGATSHGPLAEAKALGLDTVVLDHHQAPEQLPEALAIVDPNRQDDLSGLGYLCAAGVVFITLVAVNRLLRDRPALAGRALPDLMQSLDLVALATVADVVPLVGLNRAFVRQGLAVMRQRARPGLTALLDVAGLAEPPEAWHLGYLVGPRINAGGRIGNAALGARLLQTRDPSEAQRLAGELDRLNRERQAIEQVALEEAEAQALKALDGAAATPFVLAASAEWHPGIVGLLAARLKERFSRPAFAFAVDPTGHATGSGRSIPGVDLGRAVRAAVAAGLAIKGGGHAMAAGVTIGPGGLDEFAAFLAARLAAQVGEAWADETLLVDGTLTAGGATSALLQALAQAGPFGSGQPEPRFAFGTHRLVEAREVGTGGHLRLRLAAGDGSTLRGVAFRAATRPLGQALRAALGKPLHVAGTLALDRWGGGEQVEIRVEDIAEPS